MGSVVQSGATEDNRSVSVVVPALNEAQWLPLLLNCLAAQTRVPDEVIVADADSTDDTAEIARQHGAVVVRGGRPGVGRNAGAAVARSDLVMFLDADARPEPDFIATALREFADRGLDAATAPIRAVEDDLQYQLAFVLSEAYLRAVRPLSPHAVGLCILVDRKVHERVGGFDESLVLGEDHDYARRVARIGRFRVLRSVKAKTSMRRVRKEGRGQYFRVVLGSELRTLARRPIRKLPDGYEFGAYEADESPRPCAGTGEGNGPATGQAVVGNSGRRHRSGDDLSRRRRSGRGSAQVGRGPARSPPVARRGRGRCRGGLCGCGREQDPLRAPLRPVHVGRCRGRQRRCRRRLGQGGHPRGCRRDLRVPRGPGRSSDDSVPQARCPGSPRHPPQVLRGGQGAHRRLQRPDLPQRDVPHRTIGSHRQAVRRRIR